MTTLPRRLVVLAGLFAFTGSAQALSWTEQTTPATDQLRDVWAADGANIWVVGNGGRIVKGDGSGNWAAQTSGVTNPLIEVWGTSATNLWAVGGSGRILRSTNGTSWATQTSGTTNVLYSLWGSSDTNVWAAGDQSTLTRWNGTSWTASSLGVGVNMICHGLWGTAANNIWMVGTHINTGNGMVYRYNGSAWSPDTSMGTVAGLNDVWGTSASDVWAVGGGGLILRWNGTAWSTSPSGTTQDLLSIWGSSATDVYATSAEGGIFRFNGTSWTAETSGSIERLNAVFGTSASAVYIAGGSFSVATILAGAPAAVPTAPPTVTTTNPVTIGIGSTTVVMGGNVTADGGGPVLERGIVWGTAANPTILDNKFPIGTGLGSFSGTVTGLPPTTTVFARAFARNSLFTGYGAETSFVTLSNNADLSALSTTAGALSPGFAANTTTYTASVPNGTTSVTVTPTVAQATATVTVNSVAVTSGSPSGSIALNVGSNTLTTVVTAQDGTTTKTYTLTVTRAAPVLAGGPITPTAVIVTSQWVGPTPGVGARMIDGTGLSGGGSVLTQTHDNLVTANTMWHAGPDAGGISGGVTGNPPPVAGQAVEFDLGANYDLSGAHIWNMNQVGFTGRGVKDVQILISSSTTGAFTALTTTQFTQGTGTAGLAAQVVPLTGATNVRRVRFSIQTAWSGGTSDYVGLSEVRFQGTPFTVTPAPTLTSVAPATGSTLGGTVVTLTGTNFTGATAVSFGGTAAASFTVVNPTTITATTPAGTAGTASVLVSTPGGSNAGNTLFTYMEPNTDLSELKVRYFDPGPNLLSFNKAVTSYTLDATETVIAFSASPEADPGATLEYQWNGAAYTPLTSGVATLKSLATTGANTLLVRVTNGTAQKVYTVNITYTPPPPTLTSVAPAIGSILGGTLVTLTGTNFTGATGVSFRGTPAASFTVVNATTITATTPAGTVGTASVLVTTTPGGTNAPNLLFTYAVVNTAPEITGVGNTLALNHDENALYSTTLAATDADLPVQTLTWSKSGGADATKFGLTPTGVLTLPAQNFEARTDANADGVFEVILTVTDNGTPKASDSVTLRLTITNVNEAPTLAAIMAKSTQEDIPATIALIVGDPDAGDLDALTVSAYDDNNNIPDDNFVVTGSGANRTLVITPVANSTASGTIVVDVMDSPGLSVSRSFILTVTPVNDAPTLAAIPSPAPLELQAGPQTVNLSGITAGPEESQTLTVTATSSNTALIPNPSVTYTSAATTGVLTFTPLAGVSGSAVITVTVKDSQNGSVSQTFTITVVRPTLVIEEATIPTPTPLLDAATVAFGSQAVGSTTTKTFTLRNTGTGALSITGIRFGDPTKPWQNPINPLDVNADGSVTALDPLAIINSINADGARVLPAPSAGSQPPPFFDVNGDGSISPTDALAVINHINALASGGSAAVAPNFSVTAAAMPLTIAPGASQTFTASFSPSVQGTKQMQMTVTSNDPDRNSTTLTLTGTAAPAVPGAPTIGSATAAGEFSASVAFTAPASDGGAAITLYTVTSTPGGLTGTGTRSPISVTGLSAGTPYTFTVTATNSSGPGPASAASNSIQVGLPEITITAPGSLAFGDVPLGQAGTAKTFTVQNTGLGNLVFRYSLTGTGMGAFELNISGPVGYLRPAESTTLTVNFKSGALGAKTAILQIHSNDHDERLTDFTLTGTATPTVPTLPATTVRDSDVGQTFAVAITAVSSDGGSPILERGFVYAVKAVNPDPVRGGASVVEVAVGSEKLYSKFLDPLTHSTEYALRSYATNGVGTGYSPVITFTTLPTAPEIAVSEPAARELAEPKLLAWGDDSLEQELGLPIGLSGVSAVAAGSNHSLALKADGTVVAWGNNSSQQAVVPPGLSGVKAIAAGGNQSLALKLDGTLVKWGLGSDYSLSGVAAMAAGSKDDALFLMTDGTVTGRGRLTPIPKSLTGVRVTAVSTSNGYGLALTESGAVVAWGSNSNGVLIVPQSAQSGVKAISAGPTFALALKTDGSIVVWGRSDPEATSLPDGTYIAISAGSSYASAIRSDGAVVMWGLNKMAVSERLTITDANAGVTAISAGSDHMLALKGSVVDYGFQSLGSSTAKTFTVKNSGASPVPLTISGITVEGAHAGDFAVTNAPGSVAAGSEATFTVTFTPSASGTRSARLKVMSNDSDEAILNFPMTGGGSASANADLASIGVIIGNTVKDLSPAFDPQTTDYTLKLDAGTTSVGVIPIWAQAGATVSVSGGGSPSAIGGTVQVSVKAYTREIDIVVTAQDGVTKKTYTLKTALTPANSNASGIGSLQDLVNNSDDSPVPSDEEVVVEMNDDTTIDHDRIRAVYGYYDAGIAPSGNQVAITAPRDEPSASDVTPAAELSAWRVIDASRSRSGLTFAGYPGNQGLIEVAAGMRIKFINATFTGGGSTGLMLDGAAIINHGELVLENCTLSYNQAVKGGAIFNSPTGILTLERCTLLNNTATETGGAIHNEGQLTLRHCTFSLNSAGTSGGAIHNTGTCQITDSILAGNYCPTEAAGDVSSTGTLTLTGTSILRTLTGTATGTGTRLTSDPLLLAPVSEFGEPQILPLAAGSPAINVATTSTSFLDQSRLPADGIPDAGASEYQSVAPEVLLAAPDLETSEDTASDLLAFTLTDEDSSALTVEVTSQDPDLIADEDIFVLQTGPGAYSLLFSPQPNANGSGTLLITAQDGSNTTYETLAVNVAAVNDAPDFTIPTTRTSILSGPGAQSYPAFVTDIGPGADDESQQTLSFSVTNSNNALFTTQPALSPDGTLTFTPSSTFGIATITVQASDDGGTALGGADTSAARTFTLTTLPGAQGRLGDTVNLDLSWVPLGSGESLRVTGLPPGLIFSTTPPRITGRLLGPALAGGSFIQIMRGTTVVRTLPLELVAESMASASTYELLLEEAGQPTGRLRVSVSNPTAKATNPAFSATLDRAGAVQRRATGTFTATASPQTLRVTFPAVTTTPAISFDLIITSGSDLVSAATFPTSGLTGRGFRLATPSRIPAGSPAVTITLPPALNGDRTNTPGGIGFGRGTVSSAALLSLSGQLGDAQAFTSGLSLSQTNQAVVWMTPYTNKASYIGGIIDIADTGAAQRAASDDEAVTGLQWRKVPDNKSTSYPAGFGPLAVNAASSRWVSTAKADGVAESLGLDFRGLETLYVAAPTAVLPSRLSLRDSLALIRLAPDNAVPFTGKVTPTTGEFSGTLTLAAPAAKTTLSGVLLQDDSFGALIGQGLIKIPVTAAVAGSFQTAGIRFFQPSSLGTHRLRIGDTANINLSSLLTTGQTLRISGLPTGLALTGTSITGKVTGLGTATGVQIQVMNGITLVRTVQLDLAVEPYAIAGRYEVLLQNGGVPRGKLQVTITSPTAKEARAAFTAVLDRISEPQRRTTGFFTASAASPQDVTVAFPAITTFPAVTYVLTISGTSHEVTGVTNPASVTSARGFRLARTGHLPSAATALTLSFPPTTPGNRTTSPGGIGFARGSISTAGLLPLTGTLGDGQTFTASLNLGQTDQAVVWLTPYRIKSSYVGGIITLATPATPDRGLTSSAASSFLRWDRVRDPSSLSYPVGFRVQLNTRSSIWVPAANAATLAESLGLYFRSIHLSYIAPTNDVLPSYLSLRDGFGLLSISPTNAVPFTAGKAMGKDGSFSGTLRLTAPALVSPMTAVFLQDPATGFTIGHGLIRVPIASPVKGAFQTMGVELQN